MSQVPSKRRSLGLALVAALTAAGCQAPPRPPFILQPPALTVETSLAPGTALGPIPASAGAAGAGASADEGTAESAVIAGAETAVRCRILYLREPSTRGLKPLASGASVVADLRGAEPVLPTPVLTASTLVGRGAAAAQWIEALESKPAAASAVVAERSTYLPAGATFRLSVTSEERVEDPRDWLDEFADRGPIPRSVGVSVTSDAGTFRIALSVTDLDPVREEELQEAVLEHPDRMAGPPPPAQDEKIRREVLDIQPEPFAEGPVVLHLTSPFDEGNGTAFAIVVEEIDSGGSLDLSQEEANDALATTAQNQAAARVPLTNQERDELQGEEALDAFKRTGGRAALLQVAQETNATLTLDLAVVADDAFLQKLRVRTFPLMAQPLDPRKIALKDLMQASKETPIGWRLDQGAWELLAEGALEDALEPELAGVFFRRAGALAGFPDIIQEAVRSAGSDPARFQARLITEQKYFLEDASPAARLRAFDWLVEEGVDVDGFDPLADRSARRAALAAIGARMDAATENDQ